MPRTKKTVEEPVKDFSEQKKTLDDVRFLLKKYKKCIIIRPTGFGKTWMLTELISSYNNVLYLYPSAVIRDTVVDRYYDLLEDADEEDDEEDIIDPETIDTYKALKYIDNCDLMTYAKLVRLTDEEIENMNYDLIIFDEAHRLGGYKTKIATEKLFATAKRTTRFVGATATPTRMDNFDVASHFFSDRMTYIFTLYDAIQANIIQRPHYCYATYDFKTDLENAAKEAYEDIERSDIKNVINAKMIELSKLYNMPNIIKSTCDDYAISTDYMKFIVFFASKQHMTEKLNDVIEWFHEAYPKHKINTLKITSLTKAESKNTDKLSELVPRKKTIDLIACINMLNVGYHVDNQTGIFMYRGTKSNTIFTQQLGRALSAGSNNSAIVFDIVDNLHRRAVYELYVKAQTNRKSKSKKRKANAKNDDYVLGKDGKSVMLVDKDGNLIKTQYHLDKNKINIVDRDGNKSTFIYDATSRQIINNSDTNSRAKDINQITPDCLIATGHEATYREIIKKAMAEPMSHRCKYALQLHFRSWCMNHNVPYPISDKDLSELYGLDIQDFYDEFCKILKKNRINYPLQDAKALLRIGEGDSTDAPLSICAEASGTSIEIITDMIFNNQIA